MQRLVQLQRFREKYRFEHSDSTQRRHNSIALPHNRRAIITASRQVVVLVPADRKLGVQCKPMGTVVRVLLLRVQIVAGVPMRNKIVAHGLLLCPDVCEQKRERC